MSRAIFLRRWGLFLARLVLLLFVLLSLGERAYAVCTEERSPADAPLFIRHLSEDCSAAERARRVVSADDLLQALKAGQGISLRHVHITGDLVLTRLPTVALAAVRVPERVQTRLRDAGVTRVRVVPGPVQIQHSRVDGIVDTQLMPAMVEHRLLGDMVVLQGPVSLRGTTFTRHVDFSRTVFVGPVDSTGALYQGDLFCLSCIFDGPTTFEQAVFSANTRFYQARFHEPATFGHARFNGLTNFLSVTFKQEARFPHASFAMGTGFSGGRFDGSADFSDAHFGMSAYFAHALFAADAVFRRATFGGEVNFAEAKFQGPDDFVEVSYQQEPNFTRAAFAVPRATATLEDPLFLTMVGAGLTLLLIAFIVILRKEKRRGQVPPHTIS